MNPYVPNTTDEQSADECSALLAYTPAETNEIRLLPQTLLLVIWHT